MTTPAALAASSHWCRLPQEVAPAPGWVGVCQCGQWFRSIAVRDVVTGGSVHVWVELRWWDLVARWRRYQALRSAR